MVFAGLDYDGWADDPAFGTTEAARLRDSVARGARGLKVWKLLGLRARDPAGRLVAVDDERLDPLWSAAAELDLPVVIHIADPVAFFEPLDATNERYEELTEHPDWHFWPTRPADEPDAPGFPPFDELLAGFERLVGRHPATTFVGAHVGCAAEDLGLVSRMLDTHPNLFVDIAARLGELGRQPYTSRAFFVRHADRILFGTDAAADPAVYRLHYRFLETWDESFDYGTEPVPGQGRWQIHGLGLPDDVLRAVYRDNARRVLRLDTGSEGRGRERLRSGSGRAGSPTPPGRRPSTRRGCAARTCSRAYAERLSACELNNTFYRQPSDSAIAGWLARTPETFRFAVKAQRGGAMRALLGDDQAESVGWLTRPLDGFGSRLGSVLYRVPGEVARTDERHDRLARLLDLWPKRFPLTMEFQHGTWHVDETFGLLRDHGAVLCATDLDEMDEPPFVRVTGPFLYLRLRRTAYDEADLDAWAARISPFIDAGLDAYAFFRHDETGISPGRAIALAARIGSAGATWPADVAG